MLKAKLKTALALGYLSVGRALVYRLGLKFGLNPVKRIAHEVPCGPFFDGRRVPEYTESKASNAPLQGNTQWQEHLQFFGWFHCEVDLTSPPDWFYDPFTKKHFQHADKPWWLIPDFNEPGQDIKSIWELSRFDWLISFSQRFINGDAQALVQMNGWLSDWAEKNPPYLGPNWKCGQEASIRVMHLLLVALMLNQSLKALPALVSLIHSHLKRIRPTLLYALAQDNNHGTSEAAALYCGGIFLAKNGLQSLGSKYKKVGAKYLNERAAKLIQADGSFSQYSVNYHRLMLETMSFCELWARKHDESVFTPRSIERLRASTCWLESLVHDASGDVPNFGANDGAHLLPMTNAGYRDFRPAVSFAAHLFETGNGFDDEFSREHLAWFGLGSDKSHSHPNINPQAIVNFSDGGLIRLCRHGISIFFRYPNFAFRPGQCDVMHVDVWVNGVNILRDAGSYSYNAPQALQDYFSGPKAHNSIEFDGRAAMPKLSRFLFGEWLKAHNVSSGEADGALSATASYRDWRGVEHSRKVSVTNNKVAIVDTCSGFKASAVLRWRLINDNWQINDNSIVSDAASISITCKQTPTRLELVEGMESVYYLKKQTLPVLEVAFAAPETSCKTLTICTEISLR